MPEAEKAVGREKHPSVRELANLCGLSPGIIRSLFTGESDVRNLPSVCVIGSSAIAARSFEFLKVLSCAVPIFSSQFSPYDLDVSSPLRSVPKQRTWTNHNAGQCPEGQAMKKQSN
jgi:hypothetical protein